MIKLDKLNLIQVQLISSLVWSFFIRIIQFSNCISISLLIVSFFIFFEIFPQNNFFKNFYVIIFVLFNSFFFIKKTNKIQKKRFWPSINRIKRLLQKELKLENDELLALNDKKASSSLESKTSDIWNIFQSKVSKKIIRNYSFKFRYFFLDDQSMIKETFLSTFFWVLLLVMFSNDQFNRNLISVANYQNNSILINSYSTNIWIYPPTKSKNEIIFLEKNSDEKGLTNKTFLIEEGSKIVINFFNLSMNDILVRLKNTKERKKIKDLSLMDQNTIQLNTLVEEGEYSLIFKNKLFQKFNIILDKHPKIKITSQPKVTDKKNLSFNYLRVDENTKMIWLEVSKLQFKDKKMEEPAPSILNKVSSKPSNYFIVDQKPIKNKKNEKDGIALFQMDISELPITGNKVFMRLGISDQNNQIGSSNQTSVFLPKKIFYDPDAKKIISIRERLFENNDLLGTIKLMKGIRLIDKKKVKNQISNIINFLEKSKRKESYKIEKFFEETWKIAIFLENTNLKNISNNIMRVKQELELMIKNRSSDKELSIKINELETLLEKYEGLTGGTKLTKKNRKSEVHEDLLADRNSIKNNAEKLINRVERLLSKKNEKKDKVNEFLLDSIQDAYVKQKGLIEETYNLSNNILEKNLELANKQKFISVIIGESYSNISKVIPDDKELLKELKSRLKKSQELLETNKSNESLNEQIEILSIIKRIYSKIQMKSSTSKSEPKKSDKKGGKNLKGNSTDSKTEFDTPIIFEKNDFDKIIKKIREMANEKNRKIREKEYLKNLLPKF